MSQIDNIQQKISFFENSNQVMENIAKSENDRLQLEIQLSRLMNSDESISKAKAVKLKAYYQKLCEDEEKSLKRNRQLLNNIHRIDTQFLQLESKLERLTNLKKECEIFLRTAYPAWSSDKKLFEQPKQKDAFRNEFFSSVNKFNYDENQDQGSVINKLVSSFQGNKTINIEPSVGEQKDKSGVIGELVMNMTKSSDKFSKTIVEKPKELSQQEENGTIDQLAGIMKPSASIVKFEDDLPKTPPMNMETNLLREYEKHIKRQDIDTMNQTASSTINFDMENTNNQLNKLGTWSQLGNNLDELPKASSTAKEEINLDNEFNKNGSIRQELSFTSLLFLLDYIELEIQHTIHPERYYRQEEPHYKTKLEIIKLANEKSSLDDTDPADISMVILEQLPHVIRKQTKNKCLFTADLMSLSVADVTDQMVSLFLKEEQDMKLWNRLVKHMNFLKRYASLDISEIARKFAPTFLGFDSIAVEKAVKFVEKILNDSNKINETFWNKTVVLDESRSKTETSLNQELALTTNSNLKESNAYKEFINGGQKKSEKDNAQYFDESDEDDEINKLLTPKQTLSTSKSQQNSDNKNSYILKSPRKTADFDFDFSQSSKTDSKPQSLRQLNSLKSSKDKKQLPVYLKDGDSDEESDFISENSSKHKSKIKDSDSEFDFYR